MNSLDDMQNRRILVIDDTPAIHADFRKILTSERDAAALDQAEAALFGEVVTGSSACPCDFEVDSAMQGKEGLERVIQAAREGRPYALAFVDVRMPPGWDGVETTARLWEVDPDLQIVICTAYSDYSWDETIERLGQTDRLLILKKPFDNVEVSQLAAALTAKWSLTHKARAKMDELEQRVQERTKALAEQNDFLEDALARLQEAHAQLLQADKMASIGQLAAGVAHEINNPIGFISSNLNTLGRYMSDLVQVFRADEMLIEACLSATGPARESADQARALRTKLDLAYILSDLGNLISESVEGTQRVRQIVSDLRDFSHVDAPDRSEEDINKLLDKTINVAWNELKYKTEVIREYGELPRVSCFGGKLGQVFLNLLVNAAHAIQDRGVIHVRTGHAENMVWVEIADTGCGIPPENLKRIFEPFFTTKDVGKGTGMGLHIAYKIVEAHKGRVQVDSVVGKGTCFRIELPIVEPSSAPEAAHESII